MENTASEYVVKQGVFVYAGEVTCDIRILRSNLLYGHFNGEWIDPPVAHGVDGPSYYYIDFGSSTERGKYTSRSFAYESLDEAMREAEKSAGGTLKWTE